MILQLNDDGVLENEDVASAIKRCDNLDELLYEIEDGKHTLVIGDTVITIN